MVGEFTSKFFLGMKMFRWKKKNEKIVPYSRTRFFRIIQIIFHSMPNFNNFSEISFDPNSLKYQRVNANAN